MAENNMKLDKDKHDITLGSGASKLLRIDSVEYVAQLTKTRLLCNKGEWDLDKSIGIDWEGLLGRGFNLDIIQGVVSQEIIETPGVTKLLSIGLERVGRKLNISFAAESNGNPFTDNIEIGV